MPLKRGLKPENDPGTSGIIKRGHTEPAGGARTEDDTEGHRGRSLTEEPGPEEGVKGKFAIPDETADKPGPDEAARVKF